ncbi:MAG TPA: aspartyl/asparaginyl beta-hydroxylase domain-containing protein [Acidimicrobiales bacterium]|jgi:beta-hydroxylase|nr:aspartyl/asparaginyl beta-hydroxylase domain-containing protein [Acidimicrobiales bacterium]
MSSALIEGSALRDRALDVINQAGAGALHRLERWMLRSSLVPTTAFLAPDTFAWIAELEAQWTTIRSELDDVLTYRDDLPNFQDISVDQASITTDDGWKTFFFFGYGFRADANCERCPKTAELLGGVPGLTTAFFSILSPGKHIGAHRGPWRGVLRYHLALKVPDPPDAAGIRVGDELAHWREGASLLFDDGFEHEAWNDTDGVRVVLFVDVVRPLRPPAAQANAALIRVISASPYIRDARSRHQAWDRRFAALRPQSAR